MDKSMDRDALYRLESLQPRIMLSGDCLEDGLAEEVVEETPVVDVPVDEAEVPVEGGDEIFQTGIVLEGEAPAEGSEELFQICILSREDGELAPIEDEVFFSIGEPGEEGPKTIELEEPVEGVIIGPDGSVSEEWLYLMGTPVAAPAAMPDAAPEVAEAVAPAQAEALPLPEDGLLSEQDDLLD